MKTCILEGVDTKSTTSEEKASAKWSIVDCEKELQR
jgi:hypothetical protein